MFVNATLLTREWQIAAHNEKHFDGQLEDC